MRPPQSMQYKVLALLGEPHLRPSRFGSVGLGFLSWHFIHSIHSLSHYSPLHPFIGGHGIAIGDALEGGGTEQRRRGETVRPS